MPMWETTQDGRTIQIGKMCALVSQALMTDRAAGRIDGLHAAFNGLRNSIAGVMTLATARLALPDGPARLARPAIEDLLGDVHNG